MKINANFKSLINQFKGIFINSIIYFIYYHIKIKDNVVYVESRDGNDFTGNILRIVEELSSGNYGKYKIFIFAKKELHPKIKRLQKNYNLKIAHITSSIPIATMILEFSKYIITDSGIRSKYLKRDGQVFLETWHGTPLKVMGKDNRPEEHLNGHIQYSFLASDFLLYPNDYMKEKMLNAYMMEDIYRGKILLEGYPRNSIFFSNEKREEFKTKFNYENKDIFAYMPTFKGMLNDRDDKKQKNELLDYLSNIDSELKDNQIFLVKLHPFNQEKIIFDEFKHIEPFPKGYETYDILNMADCLITDYSSVFFDFANTGRKIILFNYDEKAYQDYRGTYFPLSELPFPKVQTVEDLIKELNSPKEYDDEEFIKKFCTYDNSDSVKKLCRHIFNGENDCEVETFDNNKKNLLVFAGNLRNNNSTSYLLSFLEKLDNEKYNIYLSFRQWDAYINKNHYQIFDKIPDYVNVFPLRSGMNLTLSEDRKYKNFINSAKAHGYPKSLEKLFKRELVRYYDKFPFDIVLNFEANNPDQILLFSYSNAQKNMFVFEDLVKKAKKNNRLNSSALKEAFSNYDNIIVDSTNLVKPINKIVQNKDKIKIVPKLYNYEEIINNSNEEFLIDKDTLMVSSNPYGIKGVLESTGKKFISIGDYSKSKNNESLLKAFDKFCEDYPDAQLIIVGNGGKLYNKTKSWRANLKHWQNVTLIRGISNYLPILKECDLFISSSKSESRFLSIIESDVLNVPVLATKIDDFEWMKKFNGFLVESDEKGLLEGMNAFMDGEINLMNIDMEQHNEKALEEFYSILN